MTPAHERGFRAGDRVRFLDDFELPAYRAAGLPSRPTGVVQYLEHGKVAVRIGFEDQGGAWLIDPERLVHA